MPVEPEAQVIKVENESMVVVDSLAPIITITDLENPGNVIEVCAEQPITTITDHAPEVHIRYGGGSLSDRSILFDLLRDEMDISLLTPELRADIFALRDFFGRMGQNLYDYMTQNDIDRLLATALEQTDEHISLTAMDITRLIDGIDAKMADLTITAESIIAQVVDLQWTTDGSFVAQNSIIDQTAEKIESTVLRLDNLMNPDGTQGLIVQMQSQITQTADRISQEVLYREALDGKVTEHSTKITQTATAIESMATKVDEEAGRINSAVERLTATEKTIKILSRGLNDGSYSLSTIMALTAGAMGVKIEETAGGIKYVTGFETILYPMWLLDTSYVVDDIVTYSDNFVYRCKLAHTAAAGNSPGSPDKDTYWIWEQNKEKTEFNVVADHFQVICPTRGALPVFSVNGVTNEIQFNADLVVNTIKSDTYEAQVPGTSWFLLDAETGVAEFNNIVLTFSSDEEKADLQDRLGIHDGILANIKFDPAFNLPANPNWDGTNEVGYQYDFTSSNYAGGGFIEVEVDLPEGYAGEIMIALNDALLTADVFGDQDFGDLSGEGVFPSESEIAARRDLSASGFDYDLGGID